MTRLISGLNPEELQEKLSKVFEDDEEDRPWYLHGSVIKDDGHYHQFITDEDPRRLTLSFDTSSIVTLVKKIKKEFPH